jgi:hypothetical protein
MTHGRAETGALTLDFRRLLAWRQAVRQYAEGFRGAFLIEDQQRRPAGCDLAHIDIE